jgi:predicted nucleic acid-binding protein
MVVDASVAVKWLLHEQDSSVAEALMGGAYPLLAPTLLAVEVAAALTKASRSGRINLSDSTLLMAVWLEILATKTINLTDDRRLIEDAAVLAIDLRHPLQDCLYLALADRVGAPLVTADKVFAAKIGMPDRVRVLGAT